MSETVRYYLCRNHPADLQVAVYRMRRAAAGLEAHWWDWSASTWREEPDLLRRYWNGFDADVDEVSEAEALAAIEQRARLDSR